jgi:hypothetical protein
VRRFLREPLLHFLLIGLAIFVLYDRVASDVGGEGRIIVTQAQVDLLARRHEAAWMRPPTPEELRGLVEAHIQEEISYREGLALGLDRDDPVVRRRVRQKLEVMAEELLASVPPGDAELQSYLDAHPEEFRRPPIVGFEQVLVAPAGSADKVVKARIAAVRGALARGADPATLGESTLLPHREEQLGLDLVARSFGEDFAAQLDKLAIGEWTGPVVSGFGAHLVRVNAREPAALPALDAVREAVAREWEADRRRRALDAEYRRLRERYDVVVEARLPEVAAP